MAEFSTPRVLLIPANKAGRGTGHIRRCIYLAHRLQEKNIKVELLDWRDPSAAPLSPFLNQQILPVTSPDTLCPEAGIQVWDNFRTSPDQLQLLSEGSLLVGIDEGGTARNFFHYLIDSLPGPRNRQEPNSVAAVVSLQGKQRDVRYPPRNVLLSFGGEDQAGLTSTTARFLLRHNLFPADKITIVKGACFKDQIWPQGITLLEARGELISLFPDYDLLITHFGLTCFEAINAGLPVLLLNPTHYHAGLSRQYRIPSFGVLHPSLGKWKRIFACKDCFVSGQIELKKLLPENSRKLEDFFGAFTFSGNLHCPFCKTALNPVIRRFPEKSYFRCRQCRNVYLALFFQDKHFLYTREYFFEQYKTQYGKTYLEDFPALLRLAEERMKIIKILSGSQNNRRLLDVGCAYGPFLKVFQAEGGNPLGMEIAGDAVTYIRETLGLEAICADFSSPETYPGLKSDTFDLITMWYVIEHFSSPAFILQKVNQLLRQNGVFAFSTPNERGVSGRFNLSRFLSVSPWDHFTILSPRGCRKILKKFGFIIEKIRITGHHPERFPILKKALPGSFGWWIKDTLSRWAGWGDTFEVYARKVKNIEN